MAEIFREIATTDSIPAGLAGTGTLTAGAGSTLIQLAATTKANAQILLETGGTISGTDYVAAENLWIYVPSRNEVRKFKAVSEYTTTGAYFYIETAFGGALAGLAYEVVNANLRQYQIDNTDNAAAATINGVTGFLDPERKLVLVAQDVISPKLLDAITVDAAGGAGLMVMEQTR